MGFSAPEEPRVVVIVRLGWTIAIGVNGGGYSLASLVTIRLSNSSILDTIQTLCTYCFYSPRARQYYLSHYREYNHVHHVVGHTCWRQ